LYFPNPNANANFMQLKMPVVGLNIVSNPVQPSNQYNPNQGGNYVKKSNYPDLNKPNYPGFKWFEWF